MPKCMECGGPMKKRRGQGGKGHFTIDCANRKCNQYLANSLEKKGKK